jgi:hypothetical protein
MAFTTPRDWTGGEFVTEAMMDTHVRDNFLAMGPHLIVRKTADQSLSANTTLQNDAVLALPVAANEIWQVELFVLYFSPTAANFKWAWTFPAGAVVMSRVHGVTSAGAVGFEEYTSATASGTARVLGSTAASAQQFQRFPLVYVGAGTAGTLQFQWAQNASDVGNTTVKANSTLWAVKLA